MGGQAKVLLQDSKTRPVCFGMRYFVDLGSLCDASVISSMESLKPHLCTQPERSSIGELSIDSHGITTGGVRTGASRESSVRILSRRL